MKSHQDAVIRLAEVPGLGVDWRNTDWVPVKEETGPDVGGEPFVSSAGQNPNVCLQTDEIADRSNWTSVIANGTYLELRGPQYTAEREHERERLANLSEWWRTPLGERRERTGDLSIEPVFFRIDIASMSGLRGLPEAG